MRKVLDYEGELREKVDSLYNCLEYVKEAIDMIKDDKDFDNLRLDLQDDIAGWDDCLDNLYEQLEEIEKEKYENEKKEREREYNSFRL